MVVVVDATVVVNGILRPGPSRALLETSRLHVPHLIDSEVVSAVTRLARRGEVKGNFAEKALDLWTKLGVRRHPVSGVLRRIWELRHTVTAYDASYVALAEWLDLPLATSDQRLTRAPGITCKVMLLHP